MRNFLATRICIFLFAGSFCVLGSSYGQNFTVPEMKKMAKLTFSQIETIAFKKGYSYERSYDSQHHEGEPPQDRSAEFKSLDGSSNLVWTTSMFFFFDNNGKKTKDKPHFTYSIRLSFNDPSLLEAYKSYLNENNYKIDYDVPVPDGWPTIYERVSEKNFSVALYRNDKKERYRYTIKVFVDPL